MSAFLVFLRGVPLLVWPLLLVSALWLGARHQVKSLRNEIVITAAKRDHEIQEANNLANRAALKYEEQRMAQRTRTVYVTRKVKDALAADPVWASASLPDGVLRSLAAAAAIVDPAQPDGQVRSTDLAGPQNERGTGGGLRVGSGWLGRMFGKTSSAGASAPER